MKPLMRDLMVIVLLALTANGQTVLLNEDFADPTGWVGDFGTLLAAPPLGPPLPAEGFCAVFNDTTGTLIMESPFFDASKPGPITIEFDQAFVQGASIDEINVDVFDGVAWVNVYQFLSVSTAGHVSISTSSANQSPTARIRFRLVAAALSQWTIDNVKVTNMTGANVESVTRIGAELTTGPSVDFRTRFDEPVEDVMAADFSVISTLSGTSVTGVESSLGQSLEFTNANDRITRSSVTSSAPMRSVEFWMRLDPASSTNPHIFSYAIPGNDNYLLFYNTSIFGFIFNGVTVNTGFNLKDGTWHHIAFTVNGLQSATLFVDGEAMLSANVSTTTIATGGFLVIGDDQDSLGGSFDPNQALIGDVDEIRMWSSVRETADIQDTMDRTLTGSELGLELHWSCDNSASIPDSTGNSNNGAAVNGLSLTAPPPFANEYIVTVDTGSGTTSGTIGLDVVAGNGIVGRVGPPVPAFTGGETYTYCGTTPLVPVVTVPGDFSTIQDALNGVCAGTRIEVAPGVYSENPIFPDIPIELVSVGGADQTVINSSGPATAVNMSASPSGTRIEGFSITGGAHNGMSIAAGDVIGCVIHGISGAGAILVEDAGEDVRIASCVLHSNSVSFATVYEASVGTESTAPSTSDIRIDGCTFYGNTDPNASGINGNVAVNFRNVIITSSIFWGDHESLFAPGTISDCCVEGGQIGNLIDAGGNISTDPLFYEEFANDFHLRPLSPCINVGSLLYLPVFFNYATIDADGRDRIFGGRVDMGAFEIDRALLGTSEDLVLETTVNNEGHPLSHLRKVASGGDTIRIRIDSPDSSFVGLPPRIFGQIIPTGATITPIFPGINLDLALSLPFVMFDGTNQPPFGSAVLLPTDGLSFQGTIPTGVSGFEFTMQAFVLDTTLPANGIFTSSDSMVLEVQ